MKAHTRAGEEPARPMKEEKSFSSRITVRPMVSMRVRTVSRSWALALLPGVSAVIDSPTEAAMFGMVRTTRVPPGSIDSRRSTGTPAAMETTRGRLATMASDSRGRTSGMT